MRAVRDTMYYGCAIYDVLAVCDVWCSQHNPAKRDSRLCEKMELERMREWQNEDDDVRVRRVCSFLSLLILV